VWLDAGPEELARRVGDDPGRPLLAGLSGEARVERLRQLRQERLEAYASAELRVETGGRSIEEVCDALLRALFGAIPPAAGEGDR
jgi:shikimate kinase